MTLAIEARGDVEFKGHILRLTAAGYCLAEEKLGVNIPALMIKAQIQGAMSVTLTRALLFAALAPHTPDFKIKDAQALIDEHGYAPCAIAAESAYYVSLPIPDEDDEDAGEPMSQPETTASTG
jgi:hypothetical protein